MTTTDNNRFARLDRMLLIAVLVLQIAILAGIAFLRLRPSAGSRDEAPDRPLARTSHPPSPLSAASVPFPESADSPLVSTHPPSYVLLRPADLERQMNWMLRNLLHNLDMADSIMAWERQADSLLLSPSMDFRDAGSDYVVAFSFPGMEVSDMRVSLDDRLLSVSAGISAPRLRGHKRPESYRRLIMLPGPVDTAVEPVALFTNGVLHVVVPKSREAIPASHRAQGDRPTL